MEIKIQSVPKDNRSGINPVIVVLINRVVGVVALMLGAALLLGGGYFFQQRYAFLTGAMATEGRVVENRRERSSSGSSRSSYRAIVKFTDQNGQVVNYSDFIASNPSLFEVGQPVTIFYDPQNPSDAMIDRGYKNYLLQVIACFLGMLFTYGGYKRVTMKLL